MRFGKKFRTVLFLLVALSMATPSYAGILSGLLPTIEQWSAFLPGVDRCGCLTDCGGRCAPFIAIINTCTGKFTGSANSVVKNESCYRQCYKNYNFIGRCGVSVECSLYTVEKFGLACYTASGCVYDGQES